MKGVQRGVSILTDVAYFSATALAPSIVGSRLERRFVHKWYRSHADHYDGDIVDEEYGNALRAALDQSRCRPGRVLDVCTGTGNAALEAVSRYPGAEVSAFDLSAAMLVKARENTGESVGLTQASVDALPYRDGTFDLVIGQNSMCDPAQMVRVLKLGGTLVICYTSGGSVPNIVVKLMTRRLLRLGLSDVRSERGDSDLFVTGGACGLMAHREDRPDCRFRCARRFGSRFWHEAAGRCIDLGRAATRLLGTCCRDRRREPACTRHPDTGHPERLFCPDDSDSTNRLRIRRRLVDFDRVDPCSTKPPNQEHKWKRQRR